MAIEKGNGDTEIVTAEFEEVTYRFDVEKSRWVQRKIRDIQIWWDTRQIRRGKR